MFLKSLLVQWFHTDTNIRLSYALGVSLHTPYLTATNSSVFFIEVQKDICVGMLTFEMYPIRKYLTKQTFFQEYVVNQIFL